MDLEKHKATGIRLTDFKSVPMRAFHMSWFAFFLCFFGWFGLAPLMPVIRQELHLTKAQIGNLTIASVLITVIVRALMGFLCDRIGPRRAVHVVAHTGLAARHGSRTGARLPDVPHVPARHRRDRRVLCDHPISHPR